MTSGLMKGAKPSLVTFDGRSKEMRPQAVGEGKVLAHFTHALFFCLHKFNSSTFYVIVAGVAANHI